MARPGVARVGGHTSGPLQGALPARRHRARTRTHRRPSMGGHGTPGERAPGLLALAPAPRMGRVAVASGLSGAHFAHSPGSR